MTSSVISIAYFTHFSNLTWCMLEPMQIFANGKRHFLSSPEFSNSTSICAWASSVSKESYITLSDDGFCIEYEVPQISLNFFLLCKVKAADQSKILKCYGQIWQFTAVIDFPNGAKNDPQKKVYTEETFHFKMSWVVPEWSSYCMVLLA